MGFQRPKKFVLILSMILDSILCLPNPGDTYDISLMDASSSSSYSCAQCIKNGWIFGTSLDWYSTIASGGAYSGYCCETFDSTCLAYSSRETDFIAVGYTLSTDFTSPDLAIAACPQKEDVCGSSPSLIFQTTTVAERSQVMSTWTAQDTCTYQIKAECGAPGFYIDSASIQDDSIVTLHYVEYDTSEDNGVTLDTNEYPVQSSTVYYVDDQSTMLGGALPDFYKDVGSTAGTYIRKISAQTVHDWMAEKRSHYTEFQSKLDAYEPLRVEYNEALEEYQSIILSDWEIFRGVEINVTIPERPSAPYPTPADYAGPKLSISDMTYTFGYGKLSAGTLTSTGGGKSFGVLGQGPGTDSSSCENAFKFPQEDSSNCVNSYMAVTVMFGADNSGRNNIYSFQINAKAYDWRTDLDFSNPEAPAAAVSPDYPAYLLQSKSLINYICLQCLYILILAKL